MSVAVGVGIRIDRTSMTSARLRSAAARPLSFSDRRALVVDLV